jgi:GNAT superfamily N-acetyltransferase
LDFEQDSARMQAHRDTYTISDDRSLLDFDMIHGFLKNAYWAPGVPRETAERAARNTEPFGLYIHGDAEAPSQVGFMRVLTDFASIGYLLDVFVLDGHRGQGLARWMVQTVLAEPRFAAIRTWVLTIKDAHALYRGLGFEEAEPGRYMTRRVAQPWQVSS